MTGERYPLMPRFRLGGAGIWATHIDGAWYFPSADVAAMLEVALDVPASISAEDKDGTLVDYLSIEVVRLAAQIHLEPDDRAAFETWFDKHAHTLTTDRDEILRIIRGDAPRLPEPPPGLTVEAAAAELNTDPQIRDRSKIQLYGDLERLGWCVRTDDARRVPSADARATNYLSSRPVHTPAGIRQQVLILPAGMKKLRWELIRQDAANVDPAITLEVQA